MATVRSAVLGEPPDFSIVLGGPLFQFLRRAHLGGDSLELLTRRLIFFVAITWLPLLLLSAITAWNGTTNGTEFLRDVEVHARFLVALPAFIAAELLVHSRMLPVVRRFVERRIVMQDDLDQFYRAVKSAFALRNSIPLEIGLLVFVYTI